MRISTMKWIDRWAGLPFCWVLKQISRLRQDKELKRIERIVVLKFWGMGSMILALPVFRALREAFPDARIAFATIDRNRQFVKMLKMSDEEIYLTIPENPVSVFFKIIAFFLQLRKFKPDAVIDLEYLTRFSALCSYISGAQRRVGFHSWDVWRGDLHNLRIPFNPYWHASENFLNLVRKLSGRDFPFRFDFTIPENQEARARLEKKLSELGITSEEGLIVVNPNASTIALERRWPAEHFIKLIEMMQKDDLGKMVLIGAPDERDFVEGIMQRIKDKERCLSLAGKLELDELMELIRRAKLLITNDSGPLHIAALTRTKSLSFFGPETPLLFGPLGEGHKVLYKGIDCSPCITVYNAKTVRCIRGVPECVSGISPEEAFSAVKEILGK